MSTSAKDNITVLRVVASIIDIIVLVIAFSIVAMILRPFLVGDLYADPTTTASKIQIFAIISGILNAVVGVAYYAFLEGGPKQASLGKQLMKIKVIKEDGALLIPKEAGKRAGVLFGLGLLATLTAPIVGAMSTLFNILALVAVAWILFNDKRQGWHDIVAKTLVVKV